MAEGSQDQNSSVGDAMPTSSSPWTISENVNISSRNSPFNLVTGDHTNVTVTFHTKKETSPCNQVAEFLNIMRRHSEQQIKDFKDFASRPKLMILDMDGYDRTSSDDRTKSEVCFGSEVKEIKLEYFHVQPNGERARHVMILGEAGAGKTTLSKIYHRAVRNKEIKFNERIELVVYVLASKLLSNPPSEVFNLLLSNQITGDLKQEWTSEIWRAGKHWIENNTNKMLIIIDGLDQCSTKITRCEEIINSDVSADPRRIITNLMSGNIWKGATLLTTSRREVFWELLPHQKPDQVIGLGGFDDTNMIIAAKQLLGQDSEIMINSLQSSSEKLFALCRNPIFLSYTSMIFQQNIGELPQNISTLMAAVFSRFMASPHVNDPRLKSVTKLAYRGIKENRFEFTIDDMESMKVNQDDLNGFIKSGVTVDPHQSIIHAHNKKYSFCHQSMQEFCAAIHITSLDENTIEAIVSEVLNRNEKDLIRKLLYGLVLNERTNQRMPNYIDGVRSMKKKCGDILIKQLKKMILQDGGVVYDVRLATLIAECGSTTIAELKDIFHRINIRNFDLVKNDQITLLSLVKQCQFLKNVFIQQLWLDEDVLREALLAYSRAAVFEAGFEVMDSLSLEHFQSVMLLFDHTKVVRINLRCSDELKKAFLSKWIERDQIPFDYLGVMNIQHSDIVDLVFQLLTKSSMRTLRMNLHSSFHCEYVAEKTRDENNLLGVNTLMIEDNLLDLYKAETYFKVFELIQCRSLILCKCCLTAVKLDIITKVCQKQNIKVYELRIIDKELTENDFEKMGSLLSVTRTRELGFESCKLTSSKIMSLNRGLLNNNILKIDQLCLYDEYLSPEGYSEIASTLKQIECSGIGFIGCDLSVDKLTTLGNACQQQNVKLQYIGLDDDFMDHEGQACFASLVYEMKCSAVVLANPEILDILYQEWKEKTYFLNELILEGRGYRPANDTIVVICRFIEEIVNILIIDDCIITQDQELEILEAFRKRCSAARLLVVNGRRFQKSQ